VVALVKPRPLTHWFSLEAIDTVFDSVAK
jgi:hypothetical protein